MSWKRSSLAETGFFYDEDLLSEDRKKEGRREDDIKQFPPHVRRLEQAMLDFACGEPDLLTKKDLNIQREAERLANGGFSEDRWVDLFRTYFFNPLLQHASVSGRRSRMSSRSYYYYDSIVFDTNAIWTAFDKNDEQNQLVKAPKPDLVFSLPMYHLDAHIPTITDCEAHQWHTSSTPSLVESFSWSTLKKLHKSGLMATPFNIFSSKESQEPRERELSCFPWLVVECKKAERTPGDLERLQEVVYCQAANASGCAVKLSQNAARYAHKLAYYEEIPPVASVTTVGPQVKVWITFFARDFMAYCWDFNGAKYERQDEGYMMQCIWTGDMTVPQDIHKFRLILENTYTWAKRVFKPLIATYVDQWKFACIDDIPSAAYTESRRRRERLELSRSALRLTLASRDAQPGLQPGSYRSVTNKLVDLCDQFVQDVDRLIEEELKRSSEEKKRASSSSTTRRRARTPSEPSQKSTPESEDMTPLSVPRRSPRLEPRNKAQPSQEITSRVEIVSSSLRVTMAAGAPKRRQSQSKFLAPPIEIELVPEPSSGESEASGTVADEDISVVNLSEEDN
ncbi:hypothetical protein FNAPI_5033 [Fusarium napiforme]|uniref:Uncharacterized protein n=1 Tax=Fusarium napiforme TaxID=42672 RepID=A0A8H5JNG0_9HYPO|nr:hypothetical protein FNAPI_5033 [Fusarium napiforme]